MYETTLIAIGEGGKTHMRRDKVPGQLLSLSEIPTYGALIVPHSDVPDLQQWSLPDVYVRHGR